MSSFLKSRKSESGGGGAGKTGTCEYRLQHRLQHRPSFLLLPPQKKRNAGGLSLRGLEKFLSYALLRVILHEGQENSSA